MRLLLDTNNLSNTIYSKVLLQCEAITLRYSEPGVLIVRILAPSYIYGCENEYRVFNELFSNSLLNYGYIYGSGSCVNTFTHINNLCHACILAFKNALDTIEIDKKNIQDGKNYESLYHDDLSDITILLLSRTTDSNEYFFINDTIGYYIWDILEILYFKIKSRSLWEHFHIYESLLYPIAYIKEFYIFIIVFLYNILIYIKQYFIKDKEIDNDIKLQKICKKSTTKTNVVTSPYLIKKELKDNKNSTYLSIHSFISDIMSLTVLDNPEDITRKNKHILPSIVSRMTKHCYFNCSKAIRVLKYYPIARESNFLQHL